MYKILEQSTGSQRIPVRLVDATNGYDPEPNIVSPTIYLRKADGSVVAGAGTWAEPSAGNMPGWYDYIPTSGELNLLGTLGIDVIKAGVTRRFADRWTVVPSNVYDSLVGNTDKLQTDTVEVYGSDALALKLSKALQVYKVCTVVSDGTFTATATQFETTNVTEATADHYLGATVYWLTGALANSGNDSKRTKCTAYSLQGGRGRFTVQAMGEAPANGDQFLLA